MKLKYVEILRQEYTGNNCIFSGGFVKGHPVDTVYLCMEKNGAKPTIILMRPDEMQSLAWILSGVLWSNEMKRRFRGKK